MLGMKRPKVGLLNIGEEPGKGNDLVKAAYDLFVKGPFDFLRQHRGQGYLKRKGTGYCM
jgi:glycerol-3-phosphate acyltransferase PlsX